MKPIGERLSLYAKKKGYRSIRQFEIDAGLPNGFVGRSLSLTQPRQLQIQESCPDLNMAWLLTGEGEMLKTDSSKHSIHTIHQQNNDNANGVIQVSDNINNNNKDEMPIDNSNSNEVFLRKVIDRLMDTQERICMELKDIRMALEQQSAKLRELEASLGRDKAHAYHQQHQDTEQEEMKGVG